METTINSGGMTWVLVAPKLVPRGVALGLVGGAWGINIGTKEDATGRAMLPGGPLPQLNHATSAWGQWQSRPNIWLGCHKNPKPYPKP